MSELERLTEENRLLKEENEQLRQEVARLRPVPLAPRRLYEPDEPLYDDGYDERDVSPAYSM